MTGVQTCALPILAAGGLVDLSGDKARSPFADKVIKAIPMTPATAKLRNRLAAYWSAWLADSHRVDKKMMTVRMTKANLDIYRQHLEKAVNLSCIYGSAGENREDSAVYFIDASIHQLYPKN